MLINIKQNAKVSVFIQYLYVEKVRAKHNCESWEMGEGA